MISQLVTECTVEYCKNTSFRWIIKTDNPSTERLEPFKLADQISKKRQVESNKEIESIRKESADKGPIRKEKYSRIMSNNNYGC